jgi:adenosylhomocysteine nucleosidase
VHFIDRIVMPKLLIVAALPQELENKPIPHAVPVIFTGLGKLNAALNLAANIGVYKPDVVINYGSAGRLTENVEGLVEVASVIQHDMAAEPLAPRGHTPFDDTAHELFSGQAGVRCASGDSFVTSVDPWLRTQSVDIVDMELFGLALVCHRHGIGWRSYKYISDNADDQAGEDWADQLHRGRELFLEKLQSLL